MRRGSGTGRIGLVALAIAGCATADDSNFTASASGSPYAPGPVGDDDASGSTGVADDEGDTAGTGANDPTVGPIDTSDDGGGAPPQGIGDCCAAQPQGGCADAAVQACVCADDPTCCDQVWDAFCVESVDGLGCGQCGNAPPADDDGGAPMGGGACCMPQGGPGCADAMVQACVCNADPFCCQQQWNEECVFEVEELGCGDCGGVVPPDPSGGGGGCCMPTGGPGCGDADVEACICGAFGDVYCCIEDWDQQCADEVVDFGCAPC